MFKRCFLALFTIFVVFIGISSVDAASISISSNKSSVIVGNTVTFTVTITGSGTIGQAYGSVKASSNLTLLSGSSGTSINYYNGNNEKIKTLTYTYKYKANASGNAVLTVSGVEVGNLETGQFEVASTKTKSVSVVKSSSGTNAGGTTGGTTSTKKEYSSNNNLSKLDVDGYEITPKFDKNTTEYKLTVDQSVEKIKINTKLEDTKASVSGDGDVNLSLGENTIEIKVAAENGNVKKYKLIVLVEDLHPINVTVDGKKYTVVKKNNDLIEKLENFEESKLKIDDADVVAYLNPNTKVNVVILKDSDNKLGYFIYRAHDNTYEEYRYISINDVNLQLLDANERMDNFSKYKEKIHDVSVDIYKIKKNHKVGLIYGVNTATGNSGYYVYDKNEETLSKYYDEEINIYKEENVKLKNTIMVLIGGFSLVMIITLLVSLRKNKTKSYKF